jgi:hypothetical protein
MNYSKGITWFDDCRIPFVDEKEMEEVCKSDKTKKTYNQQWGNTIYNYKRGGGNTNGRYPANLLCSDDMLNDGSISSKGKMKLHRMTGWGDTINKDAVEYQGDKGTNSRYYDIDAWFNNLINNIY